MKCCSLMRLIVKVSLRAFFFIILLGLVYKVQACKCPTIKISREADKAYDIIIGGVVSEAESVLSCSNYGPDVAFEVDVEFSYKNKLSNKVTIYGGQGGGGCGGILHKGNRYLIVVHKCEQGYYTTMCSDNAFLSNASRQIEFLNDRFHKDYQHFEIDFLIPTTLLILIVLIGAGYTTFQFYRKRMKW
jgi:hypothetical protein